MLIGLSGYAQSGKDTAADYLVREGGFGKAAFADLLRSAVEALDPIVAFEPTRRYNDVVSVHGYDEAKALYPEVRRVLQRMGTEVGRNLLGSDIWVKNTINRLSLRSDYMHWIITDVRFPNEYNAILYNRGEGGFVVRIERPGVEAINDHPSEHMLDEFVFDHTIMNDGTPEELGEKLFLFAEASNLGRR